MLLRSRLPEQRRTGRVAVVVAADGASWAALELSTRRKIEAGPGWHDREVNMGKRCIYKEGDGQQCPNSVESGLYCDTHSGEGNKAKRRRGGGGGPGWGPGISENSLLRYMGVVYHHEPPHKKDKLD
jgi:hypothetical protein